IAWFCSGHSPPLSQVGQSSGGLASSSSITPPCALAATGEVSCVLTTMPSATAWVQEATGLRWPSTSTRHCRHAPAGASSGWSQNRGIAMPIRSATRMTSSPFSAVTSTPSMVSVTTSVRFATSVTGALLRWRPRRRSSLPLVRSNQGLGGQPRGGPALDVVQVVLAEELQRGDDRGGRAVTQAAERPAEDVVRGVLQGVEVL